MHTDPRKRWVPGRGGAARGGAARGEAAGPKAQGRAGNPVLCVGDGGGLDRGDPGVGRGPSTTGPGSPDSIHRTPTARIPEDTTGGCRGEKRCGEVTRDVTRSGQRRGRRTSSLNLRAALEAQSAARRSRAGWDGAARNGRHARVGDLHRSTRPSKSQNVQGKQARVFRAYICRPGAVPKRQKRGRRPSTGQPTAEPSHRLRKERRSSPSSARKNGYENVALRRIGIVIAGVV